MGHSLLKGAAHSLPLSLNFLTCKWEEKGNPQGFVKKRGDKLSFLRLKTACVLEMPAVNPKFIIRPQVTGKYVRQCVRVGELELAIP